MWITKNGRGDDRSTPGRKRDPKYEGAVAVDRRREARIHRYGISRSEALAMLERQGRACAICRFPFRSSTKKKVLDGLECVIDHYEQAGRPVVRGLLCPQCNAALGLLKDDPSIAERAAAYLTRYGCSPRQGKP